MKRKTKLWWKLCLAAPILTLALAAGMSKMILSERIPEGAIPITAPMIAGVVALVLGVWCASATPQKKLLWALATVTGYACALMLGNLLFFGVGYADVGKILGAVFGCGVIGGVIGSAKRQKRKN